MDYVTLDIAAFMPIAKIPFGPGGGFVITVTKDGEVFVGPQAGIGSSGMSPALRGGWIHCETAPLDTHNFVSGWGVTASGGKGPVNVGVTYGFTGKVSVEAGVGKPGVSATAAYLVEWFDLW